MAQAHWFDDIPVLGNMPSEQALGKLREVGEIDVAAAPAHAQPAATRGEGATMRGFGDWWPFGEKAWNHAAHTFGYIAPAAPHSQELPIQHAGNIKPDHSLKNNRIKITLDGLRVADYPGRGIHRVLLDFYAQNHRPEGVEHLHFNATYRVRENEHAVFSV